VFYNGRKNQQCPNAKIKEKIDKMCQIKYKKYKILSKTFLKKRLNLFFFVDFLKNGKLERKKKF